MQQPSFIQRPHKRQSQQQRDDLLCYVEQESQAMQPLLSNFIERDDKTEKQSLMVLRQVDSMVERMEEAADWDDSLYLQHLMKPFRALRDECLISINGFSEKKRAENEDLLLCADNQQLVYVTLYQKDGHDLAKWLLSIKVLPGNFVSRPIYGDVLHVDEVMRSAKNRGTVGYVIVKVHPDDIRCSSSYQDRKDLYGHQLITLEESCLKFSNIIAFIHCSHKYRVTPDKLCLVGS